MRSQHCRGHDSKKQWCKVKEKEGLKHGGIRWLRYTGGEESQEQHEGAHGSEGKLSLELAHKLNPPSIWCLVLLVMFGFGFILFSFYFLW